MEKKICAKCKYEWWSRVESPKECPKCKRRDWEEKKEEVKDVF